MDSTSETAEVAAAMDSIKTAKSAVTWTPSGNSQESTQQRWTPSKDRSRSRDGLHQNSRSRSDGLHRTAKVAAAMDSIKQPKSRGLHQMDSIKEPKELSRHGRSDGLNPQLPQPETGMKDPATR
jgi:hypothetical protein